MTELEQYKKAYAVLVGRVDRVITNLEIVSGGTDQESANLALAMGALTAALREAEEIFLAEDPEEE
ncbi:MAG: hypothetical protein HDT14_09500 [Oscillibacter sp.]|nr:hypothetical protein [Oscillibacter sp.]